MRDELDLMVDPHKLAQQSGDGLVPELMQQLSNEVSQNIRIAEIVRLPGLHERQENTKLVRSSRHEATVINFPPTKWQRNGSLRGA